MQVEEGEIQWRGGKVVDHGSGRSTWFLRNVHLVPWITRRHSAVPRHVVSLDLVFLRLADPGLESLDPGICRIPDKKKSQELTAPQ
jgi:hypothetical protein